MDDLKRHTEQARDLTVHYLKTYGACKRPELEKYVLSILNIKERKGVIIHETKPIHRIAFIMAYKELEAEGAVKIDRPLKVPFPMTDFETHFSFSVNYP